MKEKRKFNYSLFFSLVVLMFIPSINEAVKVLFINNNEVSLSVVSQIEWFDLINEVLTVALTVPLYSILNNVVEDKEVFKHRIFTCGVITLLLYTIFSIIVYFNANNLVSFMVGVSNSEIVTMIQYLKLETIAFIIGIIFTYFNVVFVVLGKAKYIYYFIIVKTICLIISNILLIPHCGSFGIAYSNIITNIALGFIAILILIKEKEIATKITIKDFTDSTLMFKEWIKLGVYQGLSITLSNIVYAGMVVKMINDIEGLGSYWIANNFIWGWLLVPSFALAEVVKSECKNGYKNLNIKTHYKIMFTTVVIWIITIPLWNLIFKHLMGVLNSNEISTIVLKLLPFYVMYLIANYLENMFQGLGKTQYCWWNSFVVNIIYYGILFILFKNGFINISLNVVILMFGFGMTFGCLVNYVIKKRFLDKSI